MPDENSATKPIFLSGSPGGIDKFEGKSQEKLASIITQLIKDDILEKKVIGLEGEWGAGKSNVIEIIKKELGEDYTTFLFDAWGHQEDLTRKAFLEELIDQLLRKGFLASTEKWKQKKNELLAKSTVSTKQVFPKVKPFWVLFTFGIFLFAFLSAFYTNALKDFDILPQWSAGWLKPLISIFILPAVPVIWGIKLAFDSYEEERKRNSERDILNQENRWQTVSRVFYWLRGDQIETEERQSLIEDEPSVRQFREYFNLIQADIGNKGLVIIFDNLDRLEHEKVRALWSSIHTFFAEKSYNKTWVIVPYFKEKLIKIFEAHENDETPETRGKGFIEKTFALNFRVSPPITSDWDNLLREKLIEAFGEGIIPDDEFSYLINIFDFLTPDSTIKPRQIINYVNELVALYKLWKDAVDNEEIRFRYLALFIMTRDEILVNPVESILSREYLKGSQSLFSRDQNLENIISALTFNVPRKMADEVLLKRELTQSVRTGDTEAIKNSMTHKAFVKYFMEAFRNVEFLDKRNTLSNVIRCVSDKLPNETINSYWESFERELEMVENEFSSFKQDHKDILTHLVGTPSKQRLLRKLLSGHAPSYSSDETQDKYFKFIIEAKRFLDEAQLEVDILELLKNQTFSPRPFLDVVKHLGADYSNLKIVCKEKDLIEHFHDENKSIKDDLVFEHLDSLDLLKEEFDFSDLIEEIAEIVKTVSRSEFEKLRNALEVLKLLDDKPLSLKLPQQTYDNFTTNTIDDSIFADALAISISDFQTAYYSGNFQNTIKRINEDQVEKVADLIEWYMDYDDLLKLIVTNGNAQNCAPLKQIAQSITRKRRGVSRLKIEWALENFSKILKLVFDNDSEKSKAFVRRLDGWKGYYSSKYFDKIDSKFFKYLALKDLKLVEKITSDAKKHLSELKDQSLISALKEHNRDFLILKSLVENNLSPELTDDLYQAYESYLNEVFDKVEKVPTDDLLVSQLPSTLDGRKLKGPYTRLRDKLLSTDCDLSQLGIERIEFFIPNLIKFGNLEKKPEAVTYKLVDYLFESASGTNLFVEHLEFFVTVIKKSGDYIEEFKMTLSRNLPEIGDEAIQKRLIKEFRLKTDKSNSSK